VRVLDHVAGAVAVVAVERVVQPQPVACQSETGCQQPACVFTLCCKCCQTPISAASAPMVAPAEGSLLAGLLWSAVQAGDCERCAPTSCTPTMPRLKVY